VLDGCSTKLRPHRTKVKRSSKQSLHVILGSDSLLVLSSKARMNPNCWILSQNP
jgi:hypothetical protein